MSKTILIIDDDRLVLKTLARYLKNCGYSVLLATSGTEALEKLETSAPDLIISDIRMPGMSGIETIKRIREQTNSQNKNIPAIVITGYAGDEPFHQDKELGINGYLYKPFDIDEFIKIVKKNLEPTALYARAHTRIIATFPVKLRIEDSCDERYPEILGETLTLSEGGVSIVTSHKIPLDSKTRVFLDLSPNYRSIDIYARIIWSEAENDDKYNYGLQFLNAKNEHLSILKEIFDQYKLLSKQFVYLTKELQHVVQNLKYKFDEYDKMHVDEQERIRFLKENKEETFKTLTAYFTKIWDIVKKFDRVRYAIHKDYYQRLLAYLLLEPIETNNRIYKKPLGYPGDYVIMEYIYNYSGDNIYLGNSTYEKIINNYTCNIPVASSNVARKIFLKDMIIETVAKNRSPKIISLGCGSARELIETLSEGKIDKPTLFKCLDLEQEALKYIENNIEKINVDKKRFLIIEYIHRDITSIIRDKKLRDEIKGHNLIYLSGVYDYLSDKMAERILIDLYDLLENNGNLVVCNISLENNTHRAYYELLGEWCMLHRTEEEMLKWTKKLKGALVEFIYPPKGDNYHFLLIRKK